MKDYVFVWLLLRIAFDTRGKVRSFHGGGEKLPFISYQMKRSFQLFFKLVECFGR